MIAALLGFVLLTGVVQLRAKVMSAWIVAGGCLKRANVAKPKRIEKPDIQ
jgi:hypothetical protein